MKKFICILFAAITFAWVPTVALSQDKYAEGLGAAVKNYGLAELVKAAKKSAPDSYLPTIIEYLLLGISLTSDPTSSATTILDGVYPGSLAAGAISQLLDKHGTDIARMTYRDSRFGDLYSDPSRIPNQGTTKGLDPAWALCAEMFEVEGGWVATCWDLVKKIQRCKGVKIKNTSEVGYCNGYISEFYENMELMGKSKLVRRAGEVATADFKKVSSRNLSVCKSFAGTWYSDKYKETVYLTQSGYELSGTCDTRGYTHSMSGTVSGNTATYNTTRTNRNSRCTTVMFGAAELLDNCSKLRRVVYSTDGNCDLIKSFTNEVIYDLK